MKFFAGPKDFDVLASIDRDLVRAIDFGMFAVLVVPLLRSLKWINGFVGNYGWSIIFLTIIINAIMFPLRHKSVVSMRKMQEIQPEVKAIQDRYAKLKTTDPARQKMNQELMALYRERGVNPASGCVPMLLTMPVLFAFYALVDDGDRVARRAVCRLDSRPFVARSAVHHAGGHGPQSAVAAAADPGDGRRSRAAEDDDVHAGAVHRHVPLGAVGHRDLLADEQPVGHRPAVLDELFDRAAQYSHDASARRAPDEARRRRQDGGGRTTRERVINAMPDAAQPIVDFLTRLTAALGVNATVNVEETAAGPRINLAGEEAELLVRHRGEPLKALQHVVDMAYGRTLPEDQRVFVDALDYRKGKDAELRQMAKLLAEKVKQTGLDQQLGPLNPYERRIVHLAVAELPGVTTESVGDAFSKTVLISLR